MKLTKKEMINHLEQYPDDYELNLSHYFLVEEVSKETHGEDKGKTKFMHAIINIPIVGTAADKKSKEIRFVLRSSNKSVLDRIESGNVHPILSANNSDGEIKNKEADAKKIASV